MCLCLNVSLNTCVFVFTCVFRVPLHLCKFEREDGICSFKFVYVARKTLSAV